MLRVDFLVLLLVSAGLAFQPLQLPVRSPNIVMAPLASRLYSSFAADGSEYSSKSSDYDDDDEDSLLASSMSGKNSDGDEEEDDEDDTPTIEMEPVPMSKNGGNRFLALLWDAELAEDKTLDGRELHEKHIEHTEDHVMYCRKANLYNETFNYDSMVDVLWSAPM